MDPDVSQEPITRDFLREVHAQINDQLEHLMRRCDRNSLQIEEVCREIREKYTP